eukprot:180826-Pyramimonas_sp.AAC.1
MNGGRNLFRHGVAAATLALDRVAELLPQWTRALTSPRMKFALENASRNSLFLSVHAYSGDV